MIRTTVIPDKDFILLSIPKDYIGVEMDIIGFTKKEGLYTKTDVKKVTFNSLSLDTRGFKFNRDEANER